MKSTIKIPDGVQVSVQRKKVTVKGKKGELTRQFVCPTIKIEVAGDQVIVTCESARKAKKATVGTIAAHVKNMIIGVTNGYKYSLRAVYAHFPMVCKVQGSKFLIDNFLGEKYPRKTNVPAGVEIKISGQDLTVLGLNKEAVGIAASRIEQLTKLKTRDRRVFQDGIYLTKRELAE
ncbi:MAG: 50S ribosomal protein L6 [archaeon]